MYCILNFFGEIDLKFPQPIIDAKFNVGRLRDQYHEYFAKARISLMSYYVKVLVCKKGKLAFTAIWRTKRSAGVPSIYVLHIAVTTIHSEIFVFTAIWSTK